MTYPTATRRSPWPRRLLLTVLATLASLAVAFPAAAHLDLAATSPADGGILKDPSAAITVTFTKAATPSGSGFTLYDSRGRAVAVDADTADDGVTWTIQPVTALKPDGRYGLRWEVAAGDAHAKTGTVTFRVAQASGNSRQDRSGTSTTPTAVAGSDSPTHPDGHTPAPDSDEHAAMPGHTSSPEQNLSATTSDLDAVLAAEEQEGRGLISAAAGLARWLCFAGILVSVGALIVVVTTLVGSAGDIRLAEQVVRVAAGLTVLGALIEGGCLLWESGAQVPLSPAAAIGLRLLSGLAMLLTLSLVPRSAGGRRSHDVPTLPGPDGGRYGATADRRELALNGPGGQRSGRSTHLLLTPPVRTGRVRGVPAHPVMSAATCLVMLLSFVFDGHTVSVGPRLVTAAADLAHTAAAAVWVGGVVLLAVLLLVRARAGVPTGAGELAVRFSVPATAAVVVAGAAGTVLALLIIDSPEDLVSTPWGRVMLLKLGLVAAVATMGYVNNRYALPALDAWRPGTARLLRRTVAAEASVMIVVLLVTAVLVASQS